MPTDQKDWVIRIPRSDNANEFVLVYIAPTGKAELDLKFIATEGENPYVGSLRQSRLKDVRSKNFQGTEEEFEQILKSVLRVQNASSRGLSSNESEIETAASIRETKGGDGNELVIVIRKRIDSITQRVASITLQQNDDQTIELFEWMGLMLSRADVYEQQVSALTSQLQDAEKSIKDLKSALDELVQSKKDHENMLLTNFAQVLNKKKLKIRNQQRLLAAADIDPEKVRELQSDIDQDQGQKGRQGKRKATSITRQKEEGDLSDTDSDFERMDIDKPGPLQATATELEAEDNEDTTDESRPETPQLLEEETDAEVEEERLEGSSEDQGQDQEARSKLPNLAKTSEAPPPPRRDLPFTRRNQNTNTSVKAETKHQRPQTGDSENDAEEATGGETDDDEL